MIRRDGEDCTNVPMFRDNCSSYSSIVWSHNVQSNFISTKLMNLFHCVEPENSRKAKCDNTGV